MVLAQAPATPLTRRLVGFVRVLRDNGFALGLREAEDAVRAAEAAGVARPEPLRSALQALLCSCERDWRQFDELFDAYWLRRGGQGSLLAALSLGVLVGIAGYALGPVAAIVVGLTASALNVAAVTDAFCAGAAALVSMIKR